MSDNKHQRRKASRTATWTFLTLVPALAIIGLGSSLSLKTGGQDVKSGLQVAETRNFAAQGDSVTAVAKPAETDSLADFGDTWQNTVRIPPSPRR